MLSGAAFLLVAEGQLIDFNPWTILWAWVIFFLTLWGLSKLAWPMIREKMEAREVRIRDGLEMAAEAERRAKDLLQKQEAVLEEAREEGQRILAQAHAAAEHARQEALDHARDEIAAERDRAKREIELERGKAVDELRRAAIDLTLDAAGRVLERELKDEDHRRLANEAIDKVGAFS